MKSVHASNRRSIKMNHINDGQLILLKAEESLRKLVAGAAFSGEYHTVTVLTDWARTIHDLASGGRMSASVLSLPDRSASTSENGTHSAAASTKANRSRAKKYPQFFRDSDSLIKVAWSKSSKAEYEHKAAGAVVGQLASALIRASAGNKLVAIDRVLPLKDSEGEDIPSYQSYLCLAWLRALGLIRQHGRQGYSVKPGCNLESEIAAAWKVLPLRSKLTTENRG